MVWQRKEQEQKGHLFNDYTVLQSPALLSCSRCASRGYLQNYLSLKNEMNYLFEV